MGGDTHRFHSLWLDASTPTSADRDPDVRIAGRRAELDVVRRHLESGDGLLLVTGEAGMGKTTLVRAAAEGTDTVTVVGRSRPLSAPVPLMPVLDLLRDLMAAEDGAWSRAALARCPAWVAPALAPLLPELDAPEDLRVHEEFARQRLMTAIVVLLRAFRAERPLALVFEDLPWADSGTLDVIEMLETGGPVVPVVATWRTEDTATTETHLAWWERVATRANRLHLAPLTREETGEQLALMSGAAPAPARVDRIYRRSLGQPFFTEQLATEDDLEGSPLPRALADVLSRRFAEVRGDAWDLLRTLAVADRPLGVEQAVRATAGVTDPTETLRDLVRWRLVTGSDDRVEVRHPLLAEAARAALVPGEAVDVHARVALALAEEPDPAAAEVASHWQGAHDDHRELLWRTRAGRAADAVFASAEAFNEWRRARELWRSSAGAVDGTQTDLAEILTRTIDSGIGAGLDVDAVRRLVDDAMATDLRGPGRAAVLLRAGDLECAFGDVELGLWLVGQAIEIQARSSPTPEAAHTLEVRANILASLGRNEEARADIGRGLALATRLDTPEIHRVFLAQSAWQHVMEGDPEGARDLARRAAHAVQPDHDPRGTLRVAAFTTDVLVAVGAGAAEVVAAADDATRLIHRWHMSGVFADAVMANVAKALLRAGDVGAACARLEPWVQGCGPTERLSSQRVMAALDLRRGRTAPALERLDRITGVDNYAAGAADCDVVRAEALTWCGRMEEAARCLDRAVGFMSANDLALESARTLASRAGVEADLVMAAAGDAAARRKARARVEALRTNSTKDPFSRTPTVPTLPPGLRCGTSSSRESLRRAAWRGGRWRHRSGTHLTAPRTRPTAGGGQPRRRCAAERGRSRTAC